MLDHDDEGERSRRFDELKRKVEAYRAANQLAIGNDAAADPEVDIFAALENHRRDEERLLSLFGSPRQLRLALEVICADGFHPLELAALNGRSATPVRNKLATWAELPEATVEQLDEALNRIPDPASFHSIVDGPKKP